MSDIQTVVLGRRSLHQLRTALERSLGVQAAPLLQEAGFASGEAMTLALQSFISERYGVSRMQDLDAEYFGEALSGFFSTQGWGELSLSPMGDPVLLVDSSNWAEAMPGGGPYPSCHVSAGLLADVFSRIAGGQFAAMEVECRSRGDGRCRFLLAAPETLTLVYERMTHGMSYQASLGG
ncbi:MAG TPA: V4R domain-containing protein [Gemmatimonadales bacterium]